jgi:hypothetical protein
MGEQTAHIGRTRVGTDTPISTNRRSGNLEVLSKIGFRRQSIVCAVHCEPRLDYANAIFNLALLLQRNNQHSQAAEYWRRYLLSDSQSEWAARARRSLKFCEMQVSRPRE